MKKKRNLVRKFSASKLRVYMESAAVLYWVVQRRAKTGTLMTFRAFVDYKDAERHKAELEGVGDPDAQTIEVTIETHPIRYSPK